MQLSPRIFTCKSPLDFGTSCIAFFFQLLHLTFQRLFISYAPIKALTTKNTQLDLCYIQPTSVLWCVVKLQLPQYSPSLLRCERFIQRCRLVRVQIIKYYPHSFRIWVCFVYKPLHLSGEILHCPLLGHFYVPPSSLWLTHHK